jgi:hypothetical protein
MATKKSTGGSTSKSKKGAAKGKTGVHNPEPPKKRAKAVSAKTEQKERPVSDHSKEGGYYGAKREDGTTAPLPNEGRRLADGSPVDLNTGDDLNHQVSSEAPHKDTSGLDNEESTQS